MKDRRTDIYQNISFCQNDCKYNGMNYNLMVANCICNSSSLQDGTNNGYDNNTEISQFKELVKSFLANLLDFNIEVIYCYNLVFYPPILKENIGFYFMILMNALQICCLSIFLFKKLKPIKYYLVQLKKIANPIKRKSKIKKRRNANINREKSKENSERGIIKSSTKELIKNKNNDNHKLNDESFNKNRIANIEVFKKKNNNNCNIKLNNIGYKYKKNKYFEKSTFKHECSGSSVKLAKNKTISQKNNSLKIYKPKKKQFMDISKFQDIFILDEENNQNKSNNKCINKIKLSQKDENLQDMDFKFAVIKDKRSCLRIYWSYLVESQIILSTFFTENYLDLFIIKLSFFLCTFQISFFLNALFYTDEYISNAYHNDGILDFFTGLPKSIYSFVSTLIITNLLKILSNSKSEFLKIIRHKKNVEEENYIILVKNKLKKLSCKLFIYFTFVFLLGLFFLYYVSSFCAVYKYSQKYWFIGCLESFAIDSLVSFIVCILLSTLRYIAIHKQIKCLYVFAYLINNIL